MLTMNTVHITTIDERGHYVCSCGRISGAYPSRAAAVLGAAVHRILMAL